MSLVVLRVVDELPPTVAPEEGEEEKEADDQSRPSHRSEPFAEPDQVLILNADTYYIIIKAERTMHPAEFECYREDCEKDEPKECIFEEERCKVRLSSNK